MINEANSAYHAWLTLDAELSRRDIRGWILALPPDARDVAVACSLLPAFRQAHGLLHETVNVLTTPELADIVELYPGHAQTLVHPGLTARLFDDLSLFSRFRPGGIFLADPRRHGDGRLGDFLGHAGIDVFDLWRYVLHLPWGAEPIAPQVPAARVEQAEKRFAEAGLPTGRTTVLFPGPDRPPEHWRALADRLLSEGLQVVARADAAVAPIPGVETVALPMAEVIPFCALAGGAVAEGGVGHLLRHVAGRIVVVHPDLKSLRGHVAAPPWTPPGPVELVVETTATAREFARRVADAEPGAPVSGPATGPMAGPMTDDA
jgi:hypothetical protein